MGRPTINILILIVTTALLDECASITVKEGGDVKFKFQYPCESTTVTLRNGNGIRTALYGPTGKTVLPPNYKLAILNVTGMETFCTLHLEISQVSREDAGMYVLCAYKQGESVQEDVRIELNVAYPPGKTTCESRSKDGAKWTRILCSASSGSSPGQIVCFQGGSTIQPLHKPRENGKIIKQKFLVRHSNPVYCCSSFQGQIIDRCSCDDWGWNPKNDTLIKVTCSNTTLPITESTPSIDNDGTTYPVIISDPGSRHNTSTSTPINHPLDLKKLVCYGSFSVSSVLICAFYFILHYRRYWCE